MKPKDVKYPFSFEMRKPHLSDQILFIPTFYTGHEEFELPSWAEIFQNQNPIFTEFCSGNGEWIFEKAKKYPNRNFIAVEKQFTRVRKIASKRNNAEVKNLFIVCGDALTFCKYYVQDNCFDETYVNFPDPWPKDRHAKHRLIKPDFIDQLRRVLIEGGKSLFVTDHSDYATQMTSVMEEAPSFISKAYENASYGTSYFDRLWRSLGKDIHFIYYQNQKLS